MAFTKLTAGNLLNHFFGKTVYTPVTLYLGLSTTTGGDNISEISSGIGYDRIATSEADWAAADITGNATVRNISTFNFTQATGNWGTIREAVLFDSPTIGTGNALARADASSDKIISTDDIVIILPDKLSFILF
ncbi:MAG: hypothetical protein DRG30_03125 [Epsilonproteobacteria bacterium]|nr:MAG: hypothetical protein DRG30_03125 [Campylobacterota bacterium]